MLTDLSRATVTLEYNALIQLESSENALNAIVQHISKSMTVEEGDWIDDDTVERLQKYHNAVEAYRKGAEQNSNLYQLVQEIFGFELSERSHDIIEESIGYTLIHEGVPLKKIVTGLHN
ncbi:hypothetical protein [Brevibacillus sp. FIR094]|uniref:hypothetical protein n=1 Tax=Brevibacillus sp. FIR094 TaxID=3134809 RepID=UPI003D229A7C